MSEPKLADVDALQAIRAAYDPKSGALKVNRVNSLIPSNYGKVVLTYTTIGGSDYIDTATFYGDGQKEISQAICNSDVAGSLNNKYFFIYSANGPTKYYVWFNNGSGVDPDPDVGASTPIEVSYSNNDVASVLATKIKDKLNTTLDFLAESHDRVVVISDNTEGSVTNISAGNSGFIPAVLVQGSNRGVRTVIQLSYDGDGNLLSAERTYYDY